MPDNLTIEVTVKTLTFFVHGIPKAQPRARAGRRGNFVHMYDPGSADEWKMAIRRVAECAAQGTRFVGALRVDCAFLMPRPQSHFRSNGQLKPSAPCWHSAKPDRDNLDKAVLDALSPWPRKGRDLGWVGLWDNDSQVACGTVMKGFAAVDNESGVTVRVTELERPEP